MSERGPYRRLELWFLRDLSNLDRAALFSLYGIFGLQTTVEQQRAFRKILTDSQTSC